MVILKIIYLRSMAAEKSLQRCRNFARINIERTQGRLKTLPKATRISDGPLW